MNRQKEAENAYKIILIKTRELIPDGIEIKELIRNYRNISNAAILGSLMEKDKIQAIEQVFLQISNRVDSEKIKPPSIMTDCGPDGVQLAIDIFIANQLGLLDFVKGIMEENDLLPDYFSGILTSRESEIA